MFGTTFDLERNPGLRPCDLYTKPDVEEDIKKAALWNHALLKGGLLFREDYRIIDREIQELAYQTQVVADWQREIETVQDTKVEELRIKKEDFKAFLSIFEWYSMEQFKVSSKTPDKEDFDVKRVTEELKKSKQHQSYCMILITTSVSLSVC